MYNVNEPLSPMLRDIKMRSMPMKTLFISVTDSQFGTHAARISNELAKVLLADPVESVCVLRKTNSNLHVFEIYFCKSAEIDFNGAEYHVRFVPLSRPVATYPGTGMFDPSILNSAIENGSLLNDQLFTSEMQRASRQTLSPVVMNASVRHRIGDYSAHLTAKDNTIKALNDELNLHRAVLRKDYWIWEDDFKSNGLDSLNCPILISPEQLRSLILAATRSSELALEISE
ncbi:hypothetical protein JA13_232 [Dickeya phage vB_DsoM_JA13]|uniref:Uncharacterized protein n=3 Tax=Salmondvirus JA11 TaxID=2734141 RepID=A0A384ZWN5_9CAUD|nr:hypothetical protein JA13_232 [Dickeya phage vB_DsoM_JA13]